MNNIVKRFEKLAFYGIAGSGDTVTYHRMKGFDSLTTSKNAKEYSRQYIDEEFEQSDVVGYSPSIAFGFDKFKDNAVHTDIAQIFDKELMGDDAVRSVIMVDTANNGAAIKRSFAVIPDSEGNSASAYNYSGTFKVKGDKVLGVATSSDGWQTCTFTENE